MTDAGAEPATGRAADAARRPGGAAGETARELPGAALPAGPVDAAPPADPTAVAAAGTDADGIPDTDGEGTSADGAGDGEAAGGEGAERPYREMMLESIGGWRGMFDSGFPVVVFVVANSIGGLSAAIWSAVAAALVVTGVRLVRRQTVQQVMSGFFGVAVAAFIASRTGEAKGFFLLGIWASFVYAAVFLGSILVRWPAVGVIWEYVELGTTTWRQDRRLVRVYSWTTMVWVVLFLARGLVQRFLYDEDRTGLLAVARLAMGYPLTLAALGVTLLAVRRARAMHAHASTEAGAGTTTDRAATA